MPLLSTRRGRSSGSRSELPEYEKRPAIPKERYSDDEYSDDDEDDEDDYSDDADDDADFSDGVSPSSSPGASGVRERSIPLLATGRRHRSPAERGGRGRYRRFGPLHFYRLPNRTGRYIGMIIIVIITIFILSLIRASQVENWKIVNGKIDKKPPPPHAWLSFRLLTRYYGGLDTVAIHDQNVPEYPTVEDQSEEVPKKVVAEAENDAQPKTDEEVKAEAESKGGSGAPGRRLEPRGSHAGSKPYTEHPQSVFAAGGSSDKIVECFIDKENKVHIPPIRYYDGRPRGFPEHAVGSYEVLDIPDDICFERFGRFGPYGFGYSVRTGGLGTGQYGEKNGSEAVWENYPVVDYRNVDWADVQQRCYNANAHRFVPLEPRPNEASGWYMHDDSPVPSAAPVEADTPASESDTPSSELEAGKSVNATLSARGNAARAAAEKPATSEQAAAKPDKPTSEDKPKSDKLPRTALVIRVWDEYEWLEEDMMNIRSLIVELSMASGGRYDIHLLMQVRNDAAHPIFADSEAYQERINSTVPEEFRGLVTLWTQTQMLALYQGIHDDLPEGIPVHGPYRGLSMAMQYFAHNHPEYEHFWQWEMDARYTGHYLDLLQKIEGWALQQPRKGMWERSERFYVPRVHGSWEEFKQLSKIQAEMGTASPDKVWKNMKDKQDGKKTAEEATGLIWGPRRPPNEEDWFEIDNDPKPPTKSPDDDSYKWGVGEEADLISFFPLYDPVDTTWYWGDDITGYKSDRARIPRRAHTVVTSRVSRRLLTTMHRETAHKKHFAFPELWQATVALQHGYKAVAVPHPMFIDREWPSKFLAQTLNAGKNGASGGARTAVYGSREHNVQGLTWFYNSNFAPMLYKRWLGLRVDEAGGESFETNVDLSKTDKNVDDMRGGEGRMCLPPMLIHPAKNLVLPVEAIPEEEEKQPAVPESDPTA